MPTFSPTETRTARVTIGNPNPAALSCIVRFALGAASNALTWDSPQITIPAEQTGAVDFLIRMSERGEGIWPVYVQVLDLAGNVLLSAQGENVVITAATVSVTLRARNAWASIKYWVAGCSVYPRSAFADIRFPILWRGIPANTPRFVSVAGYFDQYQLIVPPSARGFSRQFEDGKTYYWDFAQGALLDANLVGMNAVQEVPKEKGSFTIRLINTPSWAASYDVTWADYEGWATGGGVWLPNDATLTDVPLWGQMMVVLSSNPPGDMPPQQEGFPGPSLWSFLPLYAIDNALYIIDWAAKTMSKYVPEPEPGPW